MLPLPGSLSTAILPPCSSTILGNDGQAQTHALRFGGEERIEDAVQVPGVDSRAAVDHRDFGGPPAARVFTVTAPPGVVACAALSTRL